MSKAILNFADGRYVRGQERLRNSLNGFDGKLYFYTNNSCPGPSHKEISYGFKASLFDIARKEGMRYILWMDSSVYVRHHIDEIFAKIARDGYFLLNQGHNYGDVTLGEYSSDKSLECFGISRSEAYQRPSCVATVFGIDVERHEAFMDEYIAMAKNPAVMNGSWKNNNLEVSSDRRVVGHRHDQTLLSFLTWKHDMRKYIFGEERFKYISGHYDNYKNRQSILVFSPV